MTRSQRLKILRDELARAEAYKADAKKLGMATAEAFSDGRVAALRFAIEVVSR